MQQQLSQQTMMITTIGLAILLLVLMQTRHTNRFGLGSSEQIYDSAGMKCASYNGKCVESDSGFTKRDLCKKGHESNDNRLIKDFC